MAFSRPSSVKPQPQSVESQANPVAIVPQTESASGPDTKNAQKPTVTQTTDVVDTSAVPLVELAGSQPTDTPTQADTTTAPASTADPQPTETITQHPVIFPLEKEAFALLSQILEFWQTAYFTENVYVPPKPVETEVAVEEPPVPIDPMQALGDLINQVPVVNPDPPIVVPEKPRVLLYGRLVDPTWKSDGAWSFHTLQREMDESKGVVRFQTVFSKPTTQAPVPSATATVWFTFTKKVYYVFILGRKGMGDELQV